ncbi:yfgB [Wigglesworthia glossinidia endosymbiont of Glossina brevipalpis]|uniref:Dual-specificity RNA methyltransferase RlmN n=1 Tax=Wigglesworthia glossinidia brevipalpis TaxID=36870 RepID=RLMN_WIGBR|nr:RecName: Full=Dual-specificity RNA methyltransferase RlmN; AltName: Full=23S rRNA (adenine(2503)-C(2))-methyltransferase; AltName: Full=23S rRNA m2A2503 methyltransferase; AltName: Full=Ribosomal RNA large subunit methyltransferase N; AltName: Full=tRNA (adenine(37)-C(2))-methyltransferase; AltName: Full=tRNA m2A37 methyltransferase [Wigglesworthia glossinidia endosymbiont of Glossina brevipalpis]BAC24717.1 yfgB [Wigglesworthia glossinidia endosymbiont of Glossina brevipalpis]
MCLPLILTIKIINIIINMFNKTNKKINILGKTREELYDFFIKIGEEKFRAEQIMKWIYKRYCDDVSLMTDFSKNLKNKLKNIIKIDHLDIESENISQDGTIKWVLKINDQNIETVYIPEINRATLCISSQIGCALNCKFCATSYQGFNRNLNSYEIISQIWYAMKIINDRNNFKLKKITNIVMMGMGEPLLNLKNLVPAIKIILDNYGFGLSKRRITISTAGISPVIKKLGKLIDVKLAISLHAPNDIIRNKIMPINKKYNIKSILLSAKKYISTSKANKGKISIEYIMLNEINDKTEHAYQLINCLKNIPCKINLIPWNPFPYVKYKCSNFNKINNFYKILIKHGITTTIRKQRGIDIKAACGQLSGNVINRINKRNIINF